MKYIVMTKWMIGTLNNTPVNIPECCSIPLTRCEHITHQPSGGINVGDELICRLECESNDLTTLINDNKVALICIESDLDSTPDSGLAGRLSTYNVNSQLLNTIATTIGTNKNIVETAKNYINSIQPQSFMSTKRGGVKPPLKYGLHELP